MRVSTRHSALAAVLALSLIAIGQARANMIVANGGFETGDFTDWTLTGNTGFTSVTSTAADVHSGTYAASLGPVGSNGSLTQSQALSLTVGNTYTLDFWLKNGGNRPTDVPPDHFDASFGGVTVYTTGPNPAAFGYTEFTVSGLVATRASESLQFTYQNDPDYFYLDDVSVTDNGRPFTAAPAPSGLLLLGVGAVGLLGYAGLRRKWAWKVPSAA